MCLMWMRLLLSIVMVVVVVRELVLAQVLKGEVGGVLKTSQLTWLTYQQFRYGLAKRGEVLRLDLEDTMEELVLDQIIHQEAVGLRVRFRYQIQTSLIPVMNHS